MGSDTYDVVISGAGIAGAALACALGGSSLRVALVEANALSLQWPELRDDINNVDPRVSALTGASEKFLRHLGVWSAITQRRVSPYHFMHVWDAEGTAHIDFAAAQINQPALGHIVENRLTTTALLSRALQMTNVDLFDSTELVSINSTDDSSEQSPYHLLQLGNGRSLQCALIVAADGANSMIRQQANFVTREWDYGHDAIVATVQTDQPHNSTAWQRFMPEGPLAFLPLYSGDGQHRCSIVWSNVGKQADALMEMSDSQFCGALAGAFEYRLGNVIDVSRRYRFTLRQRHATDYVQPGIALIGDAAHTIHPLAGQGINLGLLDVQVLAKELLRAQQRQLHCGSLSVLRRFQRQRKGHNLSVMVAMEGFKRLFEQRAPALRWARNAGMRWLNNRNLLKRRIIREAMGL